MAIAAILSALAGSARKRWASSSAFSQALGDVGAVLEQLLGHDQEAGVERCTSRLPLATRRARPALTSRDAVGSQTIAASILPLSKPEAITSSGWLRYSFGFTPCCSNVACAMRSVQLPCGVATTLPSSPLHGLRLVGELGRVLAHEEHGALVAGQARVLTIRRSRCGRLLAPTIAGMSPM